MKRHKNRSERVSIARCIVSVGRFATSVLAVILPIAIVGAAPGVAFARNPLEFQPRKILSFGDVDVGGTSSQQTEKMTNVSATTAIVIKGIAVAPPFMEVGTTCGSSIPAKGSCSVSIVFKPASNGTIKKKKGLSLSYSAQKGTQYIELEGRGAIGPTMTPTATPTASPTATATATATSTATATPTDTEDGTPKPTPTATATATATTTATATATSTAPTATPTPSLSGLLMGGGDQGGKLGAVSLANSAISSSGAQVFDAGLGSFESVGSMNAARESAAIVELPNNTSLIVGGQKCVPATISSVSGFECTALQSAELYNRNTKAFTLAGGGSGGLMTAARAGASATLIEGSGTLLDGQVLIVGGATGQSFVGTSSPAGAPAGQVAVDTAELYNPATDAFTTTNSIPGCALGVAACAGLPAVCAGASSAISSTSESGTTVTVTMTAANPAGLSVGNSVTIAGVGVAGYNGTFTVTAIGSASSFQYVAAAAGLGGSSGGTAAADTAQCGLVNDGAVLIPNDGGKVLVAGGDLIASLGQASNLSFIFDPATQKFSATTGSMGTPREQFALVAMDPAAVTGALSGQVVAFGGIEPNSATCISGDIVATTLDTAEVFDPATQTWSGASNAMGIRRATAAILIEAGSLAGEVILPGGLDVEAGTLPSSCVGTGSLTEAAQNATDLYDPGTGTGGTFSATGSLNQPREGQSQGMILAGPDATDLLVAGGACTTAAPGTQSAVIGTSQATLTCGTANAQNDYSEFYSQSTKQWTVGPAPAAAFTPTTGAATAVLP